MATLIGLCIRVKLLRCLPPRFKVDIEVRVLRCSCPGCAMCCPLLKRLALGKGRRGHENLSASLGGCVFTL